MTRAQTLNVLLEWVEELRGRFNLVTIDELLVKVKEMQHQDSQGEAGNKVGFSLEDLTNWTGCCTL